MFKKIIGKIIASTTYVREGQEESTAKRIEENAKFIDRIITGFIIFILALMINPFYVVNSGSKGLSFKFGAIQNTEINPGLHFKTPFVEGIEIVSIQPTKLEYDVIVGQDGAITKDSQTIGASTTTFYKYKENQLVNMWQQYGTNNIKNLVENTVKSAVKSTMGNYTIFEIAGNQNKIKQEVMLDVKTKLKDYPVEITELNITNYDWSDDFDKQIKDTMNKAQQVKQKEQELLIAEQEANKKVKQADADKQALIVKAEGERDAAKLNAEAKTLEGQGIKAYNELIQTNLATELEFRRLEIEKMRVEKWNGEYVSNNNYMPIPSSVGVIQGK